MSWLHTESDNDAETASKNFWREMRTDLQNENFWAYKIKEFRGDPVKRLEIAMNNLPLPGAFREALIAIRALIRNKRTEKQPYVDELSLLYWLAGIYSFAIPYSTYLKQPGFNVLQSMPGSVIKTLPFTYFELGYEKLELLSKTDIKWCVETWGLPKSHSTLHELHKKIWNKYEKELKVKQKKDLDDLLANI